MTAEADGRAPIDRWGVVDLKKRVYDLELMVGMLLAERQDAIRSGASIGDRLDGSQDQARAMVFARNAEHRERPDYMHELAEQPHGGFRGREGS